jgi:hypothetical protein
MIGIDPHKGSHTAVAVDASERSLGWSSTTSEHVKARETTFHADLMSGLGLGSLIQATVGSFGGAGRRWRNRAGLAA